VTALSLNMMRMNQEIKSE